MEDSHWSSGCGWARNIPLFIENSKGTHRRKINIDVAQKRIASYYEESRNRQPVVSGTKEADIVSSRIAAILGEKAFQFSPAEWQEIHRRLFDGVLDYAGKIRTYNITKKEWMLKGDTVLYASCDSIRKTLDCDFNMEKQFSYEGLSIHQSVKHIAEFISGIWQIHLFVESNTRATAVFILKYLRTFGFVASNDVFAENSWYFRNVLVRANYNDLQNNVHVTTKFLELFFENLLMGRQHDLKNRYMHLDYGQGDELRSESANDDMPKCQNGTLNCTVEELAILKIITAEPSITQIKLAQNRYF